MLGGHLYILKSLNSRSRMDPLPLAVGGVFAGWFARGFGEIGQTPVPAPIACSCSCECPAREESTGWSLSSLLTLLVFIGLLGIGLGIVGYHLAQLSFVYTTPEKLITPPSTSKGKKGLGVVGKTLQLTQ